MAAKSTTSGGWTRRTAAAAALATLAACGPGPETPAPRGAQQVETAPLPPLLPDETGWGVHTLVSRRSPGGHLWVGTWDRGIFLLRSGEREWTHFAPDPNVATTVAPAPVNSLAFQSDSIIWYGTAGGGFGVSSDGGQTWRSWRAQALGPRWQYVAHNGIRTRGDTVFIATSDGVRLSWDRGASWRCVQASQPVAGGAEERQDGCNERVAGLPSKYVLSLGLDPRGAIWAGHLAGLSFSRDAGRTWQNAAAAEAQTGRVRAVAVGLDSVVWAASEQAVFVDSAGTGTLQPMTLRLTGWPGLPGAVREIVPGPGMVGPAFATSFGLAASDAERRYRMYYLSAGETYRPAADIWHMVWWGPPVWPIGASATGLNRILAGETRFATPPRATIVARAEAPLRPWIARPIADQSGSNPYVDATALYGGIAALDGQPTQGIAFNNPAGTAVRATAAGRVVFAGAAADGTITVAVLHDDRAAGRFVFSAYLHNRSVAVSLGQRVAAGDVIAEVGNTGRTRAERLQLQIHAAPGEDVTSVVGVPEGGAPYALNPQLWIEPMPETGVVTGRVLGTDGQPVANARIFGLVLGYPAETPYSFAQTYGEAGRADPAYGENFAVGDVPAGDYTIGVEIEGRRMWRRVVVAPGMVTRVEFRP
jgi:hypothetical protein